jgi:hypothetical protein
MLDVIGLGEPVDHDIRLQFGQEACANLSPLRRPDNVALNLLSAFGGIADMAELAAGSTRSRMTLKRHNAL